jgi:gluconate 5-dehydrogenase
MKNLFDLHGQVAVVTGASSGLGVQMAKALADQGATLVIMARRKEKLEKAAQEIRALGVQCTPLICDVTSTASITAAAKEVDSLYGKVDILINNAGVGIVNPAETTSDADWDRTVSTDMSGVFKVSRGFFELMKKNNYGRIINTASMYGFVGNNVGPTVAYHASKGGVVNMTRALAAEWAKYGITVNAICPGFFPTELTEDALASPQFQAYLKQVTPLQRCGRDGELNTAVLFLASPNSSYVTGASILVDGGYTCI